MDITHKELSELFVYDEESGLLKSRNGSKLVGSDHLGYLRVSIRRKRYYVHRIIWNLVTGSWPAQNIDHIDLDRSNNRFSNLREVSQSLNLRNCRARAHNKCGLKGVSQKGDKFRAQISIGGVTKFLGTYSTAQEAHAAYERVAKQAFGEFARAA